MKIFILTSFCLLILLFFSSLTGMRMAQNGMNQMQGKSNSKIQTDFSSEFSDWRTSIRYETDSHNINEKRKKLERMNTFNLFSFMGEVLANGISHISRKVIRLVVK